MINLLRARHQQLHLVYIGLAVALIFSFLPAPQAQAGVLIKPANNLGMVAYYPMDEGSGSVVGDYSGQNLSGTAVNSPTWNTTADSKFGRSLAFSPGSSQYVSVSHNAALNFSTQMTFAAWVKGSLGNQMSIIDKGDYGDAFRVLIQGGGVSERVPAVQLKGSTVLGTTAIVSGSWTHVAFTYNGAETKIYVNGSLTDTSTAITGALSTTATAMYIGQGGLNNLYFDGTIDDIRLFQRALTAAEILSIYNRVPTGGKERSISVRSSQNRLLTSGLVAFFPLNDADASGTTVYDRSGRGNDGTLTSGPVLATGKIGKAVDLDGTDDKIVTVTNPSGLGYGTGDFSWFAWIYPERINGSYEMIWAQGGSGIPYLAVRDDTLHFYLSAIYETAAGYIAADTWQHVGVIRSGGVLTLYKNGVPYTTTATQSGSISAPDYAYISSYGSSGGHQFKGFIDEVRIYDRSISAEEISQLYHGGRGSIKEEQNSFLTNGLLAFWSFNGSDSTATTTRDISGTGNTLYLQGTARYGLGKVGQGLQITGVNAASHASTSASVLDPSTTDLTAAVWFKPFILNTTNDAILSQETGSGTQGRNWLFAAATTNKLGSNLGSTQLFSTSTLQLNQWHHGAVTLSGTVRRLYLNGVLENSTTTTAEAANGSFAVGKGIIGGHQQNFPGIIDEVRIYNRALSGSEILQLYQKIK